MTTGILFAAGTSLIPEAAESRMEHQYAPSQKLSNGSTNHLALPPRMSSSPGPNPDCTPQAARSLPSVAITDEDFDEAYVQFILYCNPTIPLETDTTELKKIFRSPPKSDGKNFSTFKLFELIRKLELKEIKTWAQLALDLGVEPPALDKGQSAQKVQQYAVRVKRWMHAMHIDAFFEYLLEKPHIYWTQIPSIQESNPEITRDGVAAEEDLALRALLPETRPKRGRRKAEERDDNSDIGKSPSQRPRIDSPTLSEDFAIARSSFTSDHAVPATAHPDFQQAFHDRIAPWSATDVRGPIPGSFRWPPPENIQTPMSAYPQSAVTPRGQLWNDGEPRSAITPKSRSRRRHGPAVSSAWPSNSSTLSGKLRGRPPSNRSVQDGPFSTFPANPGTKDIPTINLRDNTPAATPVVADSEIPQLFPMDISASAAPPPAPQTQTGRPSRLQLQVPQRQGGSVRLATPPPVVIVNGSSNASIAEELTPNPQPVAPLMGYFSNLGDHDPGLQNFVSIEFRQNNEEDRTNVDALESHFICEILAADWYDATGARIDRCSIDEADKICKQVVKNLKAESSSTEAFLINLSALAGGPLMTRLKMTRLEHGTISYYVCHWKMRFGSIEGDFTIRTTVHHGPDSTENEHGPEGAEESWKKRYLDLQQQIRERDKKVGRLKRGVLDALVASNEYGTA